MTEGDFEYPQGRLLRITDRQETPVLFPLKYYDNSDGFWDEFIAMKDEEIRKHTVTNKRPFYKH